MSSYKALYRKYRPQKFSEVVDQEYVTRTLQNAIKNDRITHAYLFNGPRGTGKTSIARIFAKAINCENKKGGEPCGECEICKSIMDGSNPDIIEIDAASRTKVEQMRDTLERVSYLPSMCKKKVYIIDEVHMLSTASFNALLKTLEEPPKHVIFILCTTEVEKVIPTIRSRCQRYDFHLINKPAMVEKLRLISDEEGIKISDDALSVVADMSEGGMRDSLSLLDQISSFSLNDEITADDVLQVSGGVSVTSLTNMAKAVSMNDSSLAISLIDELIREGKETDKIVQGLVTFFKDILVMKNTGRSVSKVGYDSEDFKGLMSSLNNRKLFQFIDALTDCMNDSRFSTSKRIYLELALIKMCDNSIGLETVQVTSNESQQRKPSDVAKPNDDYDPSKVYTRISKEAEPPIIAREKPVEKKEETISPIPDSIKEEPIQEKVEIKSEEVMTPIAVQEENNVPIEEIEEPLVTNNEEIKTEPVSTPVVEAPIVFEQEEDEFSYPEMIPTPGIEYDIHYVENILNNADIPFKKKFKELLNDAFENNTNAEDAKYLSLLKDGSIEASTREDFIITYQSVGQCNLVLKKEYKKAVMALIYKITQAKLNFLALTGTTFKEIANDFVKKYRANKAEGIEGAIKLEPVKCPGLRVNFKPVVEDDSTKYKEIKDALGSLFEIKD